MRTSWRCYKGTRAVVAPSHLVSVADARITGRIVDHLGATLGSIRRAHSYLRQDRCRERQLRSRDLHQDGRCHRRARWDTCCTWPFSTDHKHLWTQLSVLSSVRPRHRRFLAVLLPCTTTW